jgi:putative tryptophan/tyrosine transport system substrate-binding protein
VKRREFITLLGGAAACPLAARAQQGERMRRIGVLMSLSKDDPEDEQRRAVLRQALQQLGWSEGRNLHIEYRWFAWEPARAQAMAKELVALKPDLIVTASTPDLLAVGRETYTVPIVFVAVSDPVGQGFVGSLARPGGTRDRVWQTIYTSSSGNSLHTRQTMPALLTCSGSHTRT